MSSRGRDLPPGMMPGQPMVTLQKRHSLHTAPQIRPMVPEIRDAKVSVFSP